MKRSDIYNINYDNDLALVNSVGADENWNWENVFVNLNE